MEKSELRRMMRRQNRAITPEERAVASERIRCRIERLEWFAAARCVALFCALGDEPDMGGALAAWRAAGLRIVVPRVEGEVMHLYDYDPATQCIGAFGIEEPGPEARRCAPEEIDLIVVPGVAFTRAGARMGRGRGYYDKYLALAGFRACKVGVCYGHQLLDALPAEPHDVPMDCVVTPHETADCR